MGEAKRRQRLVLKPVARAVTEAMNWVETQGGRFRARWNDEAAATPFGQMVFFIELPNLTGVLDAWIESCPLTYLSPHAPMKRALLGTWLLSILGATSGMRTSHRFAAMG